MTVYLIVTPFFPAPRSWRGSYCYDLAMALRSALGDSWRVEVFVPGRDDYVIDGIKVHAFKTYYLPSNIFPFIFRRLNERSFLKAVARAGIDVKDIAVCHGHTANFAIYPLSIRRLSPACKTLLHHHDLMSFGLNLGRLRHCAIYNRILARQLKRLHAAVDTHVFISRLCEKSFKSFPDVDWLGDADYSAQARCVGDMKPVKVKHSVILHNGVDRSLFFPPPVRSAINKREFVIGCVGNVNKEKGQYDLLCAVNIVNRRLRGDGRGLTVKVRFIGSGPDMERCMRYAEEHKIDSAFLPERRHEELREFYWGLDLFVLPTWLDGFGCVYTEAYACGVPFIATLSAGVRDLIPENSSNQWVVEPRNAAALAEAVESYIRNRPVLRIDSELYIDRLAINFTKELGVANG